MIRRLIEKHYGTNHSIVLTWYTLKAEKTMLPVIGESMLYKTTRIRGLVIEGDYHTQALAPERVTALLSVVYHARDKTLST